MAAYVGAMCGDTDSVHFPCSGEPLSHPGVTSYFECMSRAGYQAPRGEGSDLAPGVTLGRWESDSKLASSESVIVRPKVYSHMFELPDGWSVADVVAFYRAETAAADAVLDAATSFDLPSRGQTRATTLRWIVTHLIEETARHAGHMDITRELIDGRTGR